MPCHQLILLTPYGCGYLFFLKKSDSPYVHGQWNRFGPNPAGGGPPPKKKSRAFRGVRAGLFQGDAACQVGRGWGWGWGGILKPFVWVPFLRVLLSGAVFNWKPQGTPLVWGCVPEEKDNPICEKKNKTKTCAFVGLTDDLPVCVYFVRMRVKSACVCVCVGAFSGYARLTVDATTARGRYPRVHFAMEPTRGSL